MTGMSTYNISRIMISVAFGLLLTFTGFEWWIAVITSFVIFLFFLWAPRSGRYAVHPEFGVTALRRDERTQAINDKAARNAFVVVILAMGGVAIYFNSLLSTNVPVKILDLIIVLGVATYFGSDFWLRRA